VCTIFVVKVSHGPIYYKPRKKDVCTHLPVLTCYDIMCTRLRRFIRRMFFFFFAIGLSSFFTEHPCAPWRRYRSANIVLWLYPCTHHGIELVKYIILAGLWNCKKGSQNCGTKCIWTFVGTHARTSVLAVSKEWTTHSHAIKGQWWREVVTKLADSVIIHLHILIF
jgi:hypothetical protein